MTESAYSQRVIANANALGYAVSVSPDGSKVVVGGNFFRINGSSTRSLGVVDSETGELIHPFSGIVSTTSQARSITSDDEAFYVAYEGWSGFDGKLAFDWDTLGQRWRDTCFGATQDLVVQGDLLYAAHHHHDCASLGMFPDGRRIYLSVTDKHDPGQRHH